MATTGRQQPIARGATGTGAVATDWLVVARGKHRADQPLILSRLFRAVVGCELGSQLFVINFAGTKYR